MWQHLLFELLPVTAGDDRHFHETEQVIKQLRHLSVDGRLAFGQRSIQVKNYEFLHEI
jgi:hypothetical protein